MERKFTLDKKTIAEWDRDGVLIKLPRGPFSISGTEEAGVAILSFDNEPKALMVSCEYGLLNNKLVCDMRKL